jgi:predicted site-specific integrase-resolvase
MDMDKSRDRLRFALDGELRLYKPRKRKPVSLKSAEQTRIDAVLEDLAEIIESEGGVLIP